MSSVEELGEAKDLESEIIIYTTNTGTIWDEDAIDLFQNEDENYS